MIPSTENAGLTGGKPFVIPAEEISRRTLNIQKALNQNLIDGLIIAQRVDLLYFSGTAQNGFLFIPAEGEPVLFIRRYLPRAQEESPLKNIIGINSIREIPGHIIDFYGRFPDVLGLEFDVLPVKAFNFYRTLFPAKNFVDGSSLILDGRMIKSDWEIEQMERTAEMSGKTFEYMKTIIRSGLTEMEFAGMYETFARKIGHGAGLRIRDYLTEGYSWHVLSGVSGGLVGLLDSPASGEGTSVAFPCGAGNKKLAPDEPVMVDLGSVLNGYHMDETRMFAIGSMPDKAFSACRAAIQIHNSVLEKVKPGITAGELFLHAESLAGSLGYAEFFLGPPGHKVSFIGHGIGLELIEQPIIARGRKEHLKPGMVFALEPKMVFQNEFSAGIESVFAVTDTGARLISRVPVEIFIC
ncbi:MAG: aminopeptidase P family protein [Desulfobacteraceae bacterium]|nr:MAG: aminopeptidase P family protein [Desulfobacteraceae bacterium]